LNTMLRHSSLAILGSWHLRINILQQSIIGFAVTSNQTRIQIDCSRLRKRTPIIRLLISLHRTYNMRSWSRPISLSGW
jgi:hypothetical protein